MNFRLFLMIILSFLLAACSNRPSPCRVPPTDRLQACLELRRQLIFLGNNNDPTLYPFQYSAGNWNSPTRQATLYKKYRQYHCDEVLRECSPRAIYQSGLTNHCPNS